eukprot:TRINITY_DN6875_c0_g1_i2.p1 TRINITY_DN6875_c0_g1~~TRINITY_DN6875_c0_g1_i2.p1  ORF type:complete len:414 (-),score=70.70 TRINITY_DN6875_c0_g1_i2:11-1252(-)
MMVMRTPRGSLRKQEKMFADGSGKKESTPMKQFHSGELSRLPISGSGKKRSAIPLKECSSVLRKIEPLAPVLKSRRHNEDIRRVTALADERRSSGATNTSQIMSASNRLHVNGSKMYERDDFEGFDANEEEQELDKGTLTSILKIGKPPECVRDAMLALACLFAGFDSRISMDILDDPDIRWPELRAMLVDAPSFCRKDNLKALSAIGWPALTTMQVVGTILKSYELKLKTEISMYCELTEQVVDFIKAALKHAGKRVKKPRNQKNEPPLTTLHDDNYDVEEATDCQVNEEGKGYNEVYVEPPPPTEKFKLIQVQCESFNYQERQDEWKGADVFQARENSHRQSEDRWKEGRTSSLTPRLSERQSISHLKMKYEGGKYSSPKSTNVSERINTCLLYTSPSPRDRQKSRMPSSA